jgi:3-deoxy-manno-octulosonate cytidylyltransferase (CMP-KDO synthetase)
MKKRVVIIIPARYESTRYPGKPLVRILGKSLISRVWETCVKAIHSDNVYVATDSTLIFDHCIKNNMNVIMTSKKCLTGTDRVYEASKKIEADYYLNIQGDEPLIKVADIKKMINSLIFVDKNTLINAQCPITNPKDYTNINIPKCVTDQKNRLLYISRAPIPCNKSNQFISAKKQVCIYGFKKNHLEAFYEYRRKTPLENIEDIEILRFIELGFSVTMINVSSSSIAVDTPSDVRRVIKFLKKS